MSLLSLLLGLGSPGARLRSAPGFGWACRRAKARPGCVGEGSEWWQLVLHPGPALAPDVRGTVSKPPRLRCQIHDRTGQVSSARTTVSTSRDEARANQTCCPQPRPGYGGLGSASCHPAEQLWSWLVRGKPSRKHHQLRVRRARGKGCGGTRVAGVLLRGHESILTPPQRATKHAFTGSTGGSRGGKAGRPLWRAHHQERDTNGRDVAQRSPWGRRREGRAQGHPDALSKAPGQSANMPTCHRQHRRQSPQGE